MAVCLIRRVSRFNSICAFSKFIRETRGVRSTIRHYTNANLLKLQERNLLQETYPDASAEVQKLLSKEVCIYAGFDPTADSLHIGNLLVLMVLLHAQRAGHNVIAVIGGATSQIGDPSGKTSARPALDAATLEKNVAGIKKNIFNIFNNHQNHFWDTSSEQKPLLPIRVLDNISWHKNFTPYDFVSLHCGKFRMGEMLLKQSVQNRLNSPEGMSLNEFSYPAIQAYDWLHLYDKYKCMFQVGGMDQKGNISTGHSLISHLRNVQCYGLFVPLALSESGDKLGKSNKTSVWLDPLKTSPLDLYQYFQRLSDADVEACLKRYTFLDIAEIKSLMEEHKLAPESRKPQKVLADCITLLVHGENVLRKLNSTGTQITGGSHIPSSNPD